MRSVLVSGDRYRAAWLGENEVEDADLTYGFVEPAGVPDGFVDLGRAPILERPLRLAGVPLLAPFGRRPRKGFREISLPEPRISRLWGRFSVDVGVALERDAKNVEARLADHRIFIVEDGDRYAIRGLCAFRIGEDGAGEITELLHDRSVEGLRGASNVLGLALRAMSDAGAVVARAWSLSHSGSFPVFVRHGFLPRQSARRFVVRAEDEAVATFIAERKHWYVSALDSLTPEG